MRATPPLDIPYLVRYAVRMTRAEAKADELQDLRDVIALLPLDVVGEPVADEQPDFQFVLADGRRIGLEHTRAVNEEVARGRGVTGRMAMRVTQGLADAGINAHVNFTLPEGAAAALHSMRRELTAEIAALVNLARDALAQPFEGHWQRYQLLDDIINDEGEVVWRDPARARGVQDLRGTGVEFCSSVMVGASDTPFAGCNTTSFGERANVIQDAIDDKSAKLADYRKSGDNEYWLLVVGSTGPGSSLDVYEARGEFESPFDRTIFLERFERKCIRLRTRPPAP